MRISANPSTPSATRPRRRLRTPFSIKASNWSIASASTAAATQPNSTKIQFWVCNPVKM